MVRLNITWGRRNPEEQIPSWHVPTVDGESPVSLVSPCPLYPTLVPSHWSVLPHPHTFPMGTSKGVRDRATCWTGQEVHEQQGSLQGKVTLELWWPESSTRSPSSAPGSLQCQALLCAMEPGHSLPAAESQEWLWLLLGGETGVFWRENGKLSKKIIQVHHGGERSGRPLLASYTLAKWTQQGKNVHVLQQDCCKEWETNWYWVTP